MVCEKQTLERSAHNDPPRACPPHNRLDPRAEPQYTLHLSFKIDCTTALGSHRKVMLRTLKAKLERVWATPGLDSYRLPALSNTVTLDVGWPLSTAATLKPGEASTTVAKPRLDAVTRRVALSIAFGLFVFFARSLFETFRRLSSRLFTGLTFKIT